MVFKLSSDGWQKNVRTGREQGGWASLWTESVCQTSSFVYPLALPQCEPVIGEHPSLPSFCVASCLCSSLLFSLAHLLCFPSWQCCGWHQCACVSMHLRTFVAVSVCTYACLPERVCVCMCGSVGNQDILISPDLMPGWILHAICQPLDPTLPYNEAQ